VDVNHSNTKLFATETNVQHMLI